MVKKEYKNCRIFIRKFNKSIECSDDNKKILKENGYSHIFESTKKKKKDDTNTEEPVKRDNSNNNGEGDSN